MIKDNGLILIVCNIVAWFYDHVFDLHTNHFLQIYAIGYFG